MHEVTYASAAWNWTKILLRVPCPSAEELAEIESHILGNIAIRRRQALLKVKSVNAQLWQIGVGIGLVRVIERVLSLAALLHDVVPCVGVLNAVVVFDVIRRAG